MKKNGKGRLEREDNKHTKPSYKMVRDGTGVTVYLVRYSSAEIIHIIHTVTGAMR